MKRVTNAHFIKLTNPIFGWVGNNKNPLIEVAEASINRRIKDEKTELVFDLTIHLFKKPHDWSHHNSFVNLYQFQELELLEHQKLLIKRLLAEKDQNKFLEIWAQITSRDFDIAA